MTNQVTSNQEQQWLSIREAALTLGTSELTIRRRIKDGRVESRLEGGKYFVRIGGSPTTSESGAKRNAPSTKGSRAPAPPTNPDLNALLAEHRQLAEAAGRAALLEEQLRSLEERYASLQDGALALANRNGWLEGKLDEREKEIKLLGASRKRDPWWKRAFVSQG